MIKLSDYVLKRIADIGISDIFIVTGGGAMHLDDSIGKETRLRYVCNHHEQASAIAVEGFARIRGDIGAAIVTTGPGGTNTITGVLGQWQDSVPALYVSGQVRYDTTVGSAGLPLRQLGDQEADIVSIVGPITKYAVMITDPTTIRYHFERAVHLARSGRPGPVWLDIPVDIQAAMIDEDSLVGYDGSQDLLFDPAKVKTQVAELVARISRAARPVLLVGSGIRTGHAYERYLEVADKLGFPVLTAPYAPDLMWDAHPLYAGRPGSIGDRPGNFVLQNADLLLSVGCRLNIRQIGYEFKAFARHAFKAVVDVDATELVKPTISPDLPIHSDALFFLDALDAEIGEASLPRRDEWLDWCAERRRRYPVVLPEYRQRTELVDPYVFIDELSEAMDEGEIIVTSNGAANVISFQALRLKPGQRVLANSGTAAMGYDLPAAIGASVAHNHGRVVCVAGDGSLQMNIQELQTIITNGLPIKIFVFDNDGYVSIRQTQDNLFEGRHVGEGPRSGVGLPDLRKLGVAYGYEVFGAETHAELPTAIRATLAVPGPAICIVKMPPNQQFAPKVAAERLPDGRIVSKPLEDMTPLLPREEFMDNMLVPVWEPQS